MGQLIQLPTAPLGEILPPEDSVSPAASYLARLGEGSRRTMRQALTKIATDCSEGLYGADDYPWASLRYQETQAIRARLAKQYARATANKMLSALRGVMKECWRLGQLNVEEMARACDLEPIRGKREPKGRALTDEEIGALLVSVLPYHAKLIRFMLVTGLRRAETSALRWADINDGILTVRGKGGKERLVPLTEKALRSLPEPTSERVFAISPGRIWHVLREAAFRAQIRPLSPHDLRRTYATRLLGSGVDLATVQRLMGHSNPATTAGYDKRGADEAAKAVEGVWGNL